MKRPGTGIAAAAAVFMLLSSVAAPVFAVGDALKSRAAELTSGPAILGGGVMLGEPSGFSAKLWFAESGFAVDAAVAWSFVGESSLYMHSSGLFHFSSVETEGGQFILPYGGVGLTWRARSTSSLALRIPVGASIFAFPELPLEFFLEIVPVMQIVPSTEAEFGAGIGARVYFPLSRSR